MVTDDKNILKYLKVLLVEDDVSEREELSRFLKRRVGKLHTAGDGKEGIKVFKKYKPDIIITDLRMPIMDGLEMINKLRKEGFKCSIIVLSALSDSETILKAVDKGIVKYVVKPVDTKKLLFNMKEIASNLFKDKNESIIDDSFILDRQNKQKIEKNIKAKFAYFLKSYTGKGPRNVKTFIKGNNIQIIAESVLTILELSIISNNRNNSLVEYNRRLFYKENKRKLEKEIEKLIGSNVTFENIESDSKSNTDNITLSFS
ncbi:MAG: response regulator [Firmicutes bacterium]|nr:response regulator [Bacillota bacterium]